jgi:hypothetical protein
MTYEELIALKDLGEPFLLIDTRDKGSYDQDHIDGPSPFL